MEYEDIVSGQGKLNKNVYLKDNNKKGIEFKDKDILFGKLRPYLNKWLISDFNGIAVGDFWVLRSNNLESAFIYYLIQTNKFRTISNISTGTRMPRADWNIVSTNQFHTPQNNEEAKYIGKLIYHIDKSITLHQRKINILLKLKQNLMVYLFPKEENILPELRFSGFYAEWEQRRLGDFGSVAMNRRVFKDETSDTEEVPFYKIGTFGKEPNSFISRKKFEDYKNKYPYPEVGDILISASGSIGRTIEYKGEEAYYQDSNIVWLKHDGSIDNLFLKQYYNIIKWDGIEGTTIKRLYNKSILNTKVTFPQIREQKKIGLLFKVLDDTIALHQSKISILNKIKKVYLNKMFL